MVRYMVLTSGTAEAWQAMIKNPHDRLEALRPLIESLGGRYEHYWFAPWNGKAIGVVELPDETTAAALAAVGRASGVTENYEMWPVLTSAEAVEFLSTAGSIDYHPPG